MVQRSCRADVRHVQAVDRRVYPARHDLVVRVDERQDVRGRQRRAPIPQLGHPALLHANDPRAELRRDLGRAIGGSVVDDDDLHVPGPVVVPQDAAETGLQPNGVVAHRHDERDARRVHGLGWPSVHSGVMPDGATLNTSYMLGMLVNISTMNITVQTIR